MRVKEEYIWLGVFLVLTALWTADNILDLGLTPNPLDLPTSGVSFKQVRPIFKERCSECHSSRLSDWTDYDTAYWHRTQIKFRVWTLKNMPARGEMPASERELVREWVDDGGKP